MATMYLNLAQAAGMASQNAVTNQQHLNILGAAAVAAGTSGLLRNGFAEQVEKLTPTERLDYLQKLLTLATNPAATPAATPNDASADPAAPAAGGATSQTPPPAAPASAPETAATKGDTKAPTPPTTTP